MKLNFRSTTSGAWVADVGEIQCFNYHPEGPDQTALALADDLTDGMDTSLRRARDYLDLFVDRGKACGDPQEDWQLIEMELGTQHANGRPFVRLCFDLHGDDGGYWSVYFRQAQNEIRPYQFDRTQG
ncbi:hypothetical protein GV829_02075 [Sphingomonas lacunae]|uniref:Uncharacterized protein n=1 Tax=Sphingomonas lacunae TaxID=2698828 RepID=A0A6M4AST1_9SPHN|nr:hypothetical protein [Sphingomonas lacunae]QJQ31382.1 hypothetical protein GV829_02075 [Sphingomonas lacunae]